MQSIVATSHRADYDKLLMNRSGEDHRQKIDLLNLIDQTKTSAELMGSQAWELSLRNTEEEGTGAKKKHFLKPVSDQSNIRKVADKYCQQFKKDDHHLRVPSSSGGIFVKSSVASEFDYQIARRPQQFYSPSNSTTPRIAMSQSMQSFYQTSQREKRKHVEHLISNLPPKKKHLKQLFFSNCEDLMVTLLSAFLKGGGRAPTHPGSDPLARQSPNARILRQISARRFNV